MHFNILLKLKYLFRSKFCVAQEETLPMRSFNFKDLSNEVAPKLIKLNWLRLIRNLEINYWLCLSIRAEFPVK